MGIRPPHHQPADPSIWEMMPTFTDPLSAAGVRTHELEALAAARAIVLLESQALSPERWRRLKRALTKRK